MTLDIDRAQSSSTLDTFKNYDSTTGSISVPVQSYTSGQYRAFNTTVDLERVDAVTQVLQNFSFDSAKYYAGTFVQVDFDSSQFRVQTRMTMSGSTLSVDLYVVNISGGTHDVPAFTLSLEVRRFTAPFN